MSPRHQLQLRRGCERGRRERRTADRARLLGSPAEQHLSSIASVAAAGKTSPPTNKARVALTHVLVVFGFVLLHFFSIKVRLTLLFRFAQCLAPANCIGGPIHAAADAYCAEARTGPLCALCVDGYASVTQRAECRECPQDDVASGLTVLFSLLFLAALGVL